MRRKFGSSRLFVGRWLWMLFNYFLFDKWIIINIKITKFNQTNIYLLISLYLINTLYLLKTILNYVLRELGVWLDYSTLTKLFFTITISIIVTILLQAHYLMLIISHWLHYYIKIIAEKWKKEKELDFLIFQFFLQFSNGALSKWFLYLRILH